MPNTGGGVPESGSVPPRANSGDLFGGPSARDHVDARAREKDAERNGLNGGRAPADKGGLFEQPREPVPAQSEVPGGAESELPAVRESFATQKEAGLFASNLKGDARVSKTIGKDGKARWVVERKAGRIGGEPQRSASNGEREGSESYSGIPQHLPGKITDASRRLARTINRQVRAGRSDKEIARVREVNKDSLPDSVLGAVTALEKMGGVEVHIIRVENPEASGADFNGVTLQDGHLYVSESAEMPVTTVASHEFFHDLRRTAPDLAGELMAEVSRQGRLKKWEARSLEMGYRPGEGLKELTANATGDALSDPAFLQRMAEQNPSAFRSLAERFIAFLNRFVDGFRDTQSREFLTDVEAFRDRLAGVLDEFSRRKDAGELEPRNHIPDVERGEPDYARKMGDDDRGPNAHLIDKLLIERLKDQCTRGAAPAHYCDKCGGTGGVPWSYTRRADAYGAHHTDFRDRLAPGYARALRALANMEWTILAAGRRGDAVDAGALPELPTDDSVQEIRPVVEPRKVSVLVKPKPVDRIACWRERQQKRRERAAA